MSLPKQYSKNLFKLSLSNKLLAYNIFLWGLGNLKNKNNILRNEQFQKNIYLTD